MELSYYVDKAKEILHSCNVPCDYATRVTISLKETGGHNLGICNTTCTILNCEVCYNHQIYLNPALMSMNNDSILNTLTHEYLHTIDTENGHTGHTGLFKIYANIINQKYGMNISRLASHKESNDFMTMGINMGVYHYKVTCVDCGQTVCFRNKSKIVKQLLQYPNHEGQTTFRCNTCHNDVFKLEIL